jgi:hypothetical protein
MAGEVGGGTDPAVRAWRSPASPEFHTTSGGVICASSFPPAAAADVGQSRVCGKPVYSTKLQPVGFENKNGLPYRNEIHIRELGETTPLQTPAGE